MDYSWVDGLVADIVASALVMRHRQIRVIQQLSAVMRCVASDIRPLARSPINRLPDEMSGGDAPFIPVRR
jgi:hypothetical protein